MAAPNPSLQLVTYTDPGLPNPPGTAQWGVFVNAVAGTVPSGQCLALCLTGMGQPAVYGLGVANTGNALIPVTGAPLSAGLPYSVLAQWAPPGTDPSKLSWVGPAVSTAPVVTQRPRIVGGSVALSGATATVSLVWDSGAGPGLGGAWAQVMNAQGAAIGYSQASASFTATISNLPLQLPGSYWLYPFGLQSIGSGSFASPYSQGPAGAACLLPVSYPAVTGVTYDGAELAVAWQPAGQLPAGMTSRDAAYWLQLYKGASLVGTFPAAATGARLATTLTADVTVAGAISLGPLTGPSSPPQAVLAAAPSVVSISLAPDSQVAGNTVVSVVLAPAPGQPAWAAIQVALVQNGVAGQAVAAAGTPPQAKFSAALAPGGSYAVQAWLASTGTPVAVAGPAGAAAPLAAGAPTVTGLAYDRNQLTVSWSAVGGSAVTGYAVNLTGALGGNYATGLQTSLTIPAALAPGSSVTAVVTPVGPRFTGLTSAQYGWTLPALGPAPQVTECAFDGASLALNWSPSGGPGLDSYAVKLWGVPDAGQQLNLAYFTQLAPGLQVALPGDVARTWSANVTPLAGSNNGAASSTVTVVTAVAAITAVSVAPNLLTASWAIEGATRTLLDLLRTPANNALVQAALLDGEQIVATGSAQIGDVSGTVQVALPPTLDPRRLSLATQIALPPAVGPRSGTVAVLALAPTAVTASYDGRWLTMGWNGGGQEGVLGYTVTVGPPAGQAIVLQTGPETTLQVACDLDLGKTWQATVQPFGANTTGVASAAVAVAMPDAAFAPGLVSLQYDGRQVTVSWGASNLPYLTGYYVFFDSPTYHENYGTGPETTFTVPLPLTQAAGVSVSAYGISSTPNRTSPTCNAFALITASPVISSVAISGGNAVVQWSPPPASAPAGTTATAEILDGDTVVASIAGTATGVSIPLTALGQSLRYSVRGFFSAGFVGGPRSGAVAVLAAPPAIRLAAYDGQRLLLSWLGAQEGVLGHAIGLIPSSGTPVTFEAGPETTLVVPWDLDLTKTWQVAIGTLGANSAGAISAPFSVALPAALNSPAVTAADYDGVQFTLAWNAPNLPYLTGYQIALSGTTTASFLVGAGTTFSTPLTPAQAAGTSVTVTGCSTLRNSPASAAVALLAGAPSIGAVAVAGGKINVTWTLAAPLPAGATAAAELLDGDEVVATAAGTTSGASLTPPAQPTGRLRVRGLVTSAPAAGPRSGAVAVLILPPTAVTASYDGRWLTMGWNGGGQEGVLGYTVTLAPSSGTALVFQTGPETVLQVACGLDLTKTWQASVQAFGASSAGVASAALGVTLPAALTAPALTAADYDGVQLALAWNAPNLPYLTGYQIALSGTTAASFSVGSETAFTLPLTPAQAAGTSVSLTGVSALRNSPASATVALLAAAPQISAVAVSGGSIAVAWTATLPGSAQAVAEVLDGGTAIATVAGTSSGASFPLSALGAGTGARYAVRGFLSATGANGPRSGSVSILAATPALLSASYDGQWLALSWSGGGQEGVLGYVVTLTPSSGGPVVFRTGPETALQASCSLDPTKTWQATVQPFGANTTGVASAAFGVVLAPAIAAAGYTSAGVLQASWNATPGAVAYNVELSGGLAPAVTLQTTSPALPTAGVALAAGSYQLRVQAVLSTANPSLVSPWSPAVPVFNLAAGGLEAAYDGRTARLQWPAVPAEAVLGYRVTVLNGSAAVAPTPVTTTACEVAIPLPFAAGATYTATVQAITAAGAGAPLAAAVPLFQPGLYPSTDPAKAPYLAPAADPTLAAQAIVINLPEIFPAHVTTGLPAVAPFVMSATGVPAPFAYTLTLAAASAVWTFDVNPVRAAVQTAWQNFLTSLIGLNITPLGWQTVQDALARVMPQTFAETLLYGYGFSPAQGCVDLRPGMVLRAEYEAYQYVGPSQPAGSYLDGYVGSCTAEYEVSSYVDSTARWLTGFDAFLAQVTGPGGSSVPTPATQGGNTQGGGGAPDFFFSQFRQPFCRIVFPPAFPDQGTTGSAQPWTNVAVLAAPDYGTLQSDTARVRNGLPPATAAIAYLRGRATLTACIRVWLDGAPLVVPLGTTVGNLLEQRGCRPPLMGNLPVSGLTVRRSVGAAITDATVGTGGCAAGAARTIALDWLTAPAYGPFSDRLSLPLFAGDQILLRGTGT